MLYLAYLSDITTLYLAYTHHYILYVISKSTLTRVSSGIRRCNLRAGRNYTPNTDATVLIEVIVTWAHEGTIQVQAVAIGEIVRSRRPIVAVTTSTVGGRRIEAAGVEEVIRETSNCFCGSLTRSISCILVVAIATRCILIWFHIIHDCLT